MLRLQFQHPSLQGFQRLGNRSLPVESQSWYQRTPPPSYIGSDWREYLFVILSDFVTCLDSVVRVISYKMSRLTGRAFLFKPVRPFDPTPQTFNPTKTPLSTPKTYENPFTASKHEHSCCNSLLRLPRAMNRFKQAKTASIQLRKRKHKP